MSLQIVEVTSSKHLKEFVKFPFLLYKSNSYWVPPLLKDEFHVFDPAKNPALRHAECILLLAFRGGKPVGRIAGIINHTENEAQGLSRARFGWFDTMDEYEISEGLLSWIFQWAKDRGMKSVEGPMGFTNLDKAGLLIEGFDEVPTVATLYNYPYYKDHLERLGFQKAADYLEYEFHVPDHIPERVTKFAEMVAEKYTLKLIEERDMRSVMGRYGRKFFDLVNQTHAELYGFVPFDDAFADYYTAKFIRLLHPDFVALVVDKNDNLVAYSITMPSFSEAFKKAGGKLFPFGIYHLWKAFKKVKKIDLMLIGVEKKLRNKGVIAIVFNKMIESYIARGVERVESNPELEENQEVRAMWKNYEYRQHKRRRSFRKTL